MSTILRGLRHIRRTPSFRPARFHSALLFYDPLHHIFGRLHQALLGAKIPPIILVCAESLDVLSLARHSKVCGNNREGVRLRHQGKNSR